MRKAISKTIQHRSNPNGNINNLSKHSFTKGQHDPLNKNLSFCSTPGHYNKSILKRIQKVSTGRLSQKHSSAIKKYKKKKPNQQTKKQILKVKPIRNPKRNHHAVETFIEAVNKDIVERFSHKNKLPKNNLTDTDKNATEYFSKRNDLVITKAGKGGVTVFLVVKDYITIENKQVQDNAFYQKLNAYPTAKHSEIVNFAIENFRK